MKETVIVRYGEISLKSEPVREKFEKILINNIHSSLEGIPHKIIQERGRIFVETESSKKVALKLSNIPGIVSTSPAKKTKSEMEKIKSLARAMVKEKFSDGGTFAINARRAGNHSFSSKDIEEEVGSEILKIKPTLEVDLDSPEQVLNIEARQKNSYVFIDKIPAIGGLPVGCQGKTVNPYIENQINNTISSILLLKRGSPVYPLIFNPSEELEKPKLEKPIELLKEVNSNIKLATVDVAEVEDKISKISPDDYEELVREKIFLKISEKVANKIGAEALISGKKPQKSGLKQIRLLESGIDFPVLHPLAGLTEGLGKETKEKVESELGKETLDNLGRFDGKRVKQEKLNRLMEQVRDDISYKSIYKSLNIQKPGEIEWI